MAEFLSEMEGVQMENDAGDRNPGELKRLDKGKQVLVGHQGDGSGDYNKGDQQNQGGGAENTFLAMQETQGNGDRVAIKAKPIPMVTDESKPRLRWTYELHECFLDAVTRLGGAKSATPKTILNMMDIDGLHRLQVKSHLQKYRTGKISPTDWQDTSRNGGPRRLRPLSTVPSMIFKKRRARSGRSRKEEHGVLYMKIRVCKHHSGGSAFRRCSYGQPWASPGIFTTIPVPFCFGTVTELPQFYLNQQDACLQTYGTLNGLANLSLQELPSGYQPQTYLDPAPDAFTTPNGSSANSYQETSPVLPGSEVEMDQPDDEDSLEVKTPNSSSASSYQVTWPVLPGSDVEMVQPDDEDSVEVMTPNGSSASSYSPVLPGSEMEMVWPDDEDPLEAFLNWNDDEPINLDALNFQY